MQAGARAEVTACISSLWMAVVRPRRLKGAAHLGVSHSVVTYYHLPYIFAGCLSLTSGPTLECPQTDTLGDPSRLSICWGGGRGRWWGVSRAGLPPKVLGSQHPGGAPGASGECRQGCIFPKGGAVENRPGARKPGGKDVGLCLDGAPGSARRKGGRACTGRPPGEKG